MPTISTPENGSKILKTEIDFASRYDDAQVRFTIENAYENMGKNIYDVISLEIYKLIEKLNEDIEPNIPMMISKLNDVEVTKFDLAPKESAFAFRRKNSNEGYLILDAKKTKRLHELTVFKYVKELDTEEINNIVNEYGKNSSLTKEIINSIDNGSINIVKDEYENICGGRDLKSILTDLSEVDHSKRKSNYLYKTYAVENTIEGIDKDLGIEIRDMSRMKNALVNLEYYKDLCDLFGIDEKTNEVNKNLIFKIGNYSNKPLQRIADISAIQCKTVFDHHVKNIKEAMAIAKEMSLDIKTRYCFNDCDIRIHFEPSHEIEKGKEVDILLESNIDLFCGLDFVNVFHKENDEITRWDAYYCARNTEKDDYDFEDDDEEEEREEDEQDHTIEKIIKKISRDYEKYIEKYPTLTSSETIKRIKKGETPNNIAISYDVKTSEFTMFDLALSNSYLSYAKYVFEGAFDIIKKHHDGKLGKYDRIEISDDEDLASYEEVIHMEKTLKI